MIEVDDHAAVPRHVRAIHGTREDDLFSVGDLACRLRQTTADLLLVARVDIVGVSNIDDHRLGGFYS